MTEDDIEQELLKLELVADSIEAPEKKFISKDEAVEVGSMIGRNEYKEKIQEKENFKKQLKEEIKVKPTVLRTEAGKIWNDPSLSEWPENDFRIKVDDLHVSVTDKILHDAFKQYKSLAKVHVVTDSSGRSRRYGFVSLLDINDYIDAMTVMPQSFIGPRRAKLTPSKWKSKLLPK